MCTGTDLGYLFALLPGRGFVEFQVEANDKLHEHIGNVCSDWWERHIVQGHDVPMTVKPALEVVKRLRKTPNKVIEADSAFEDLLTLRQAAKECEKQAKSQVEEIESKLLVKLGDAEAANLSDGRQFTYLETKRKSYTVAETSYRTIRIKKGK
jgi:predicted phage-related endonuclease